ncbi:hypothetical protein PICSAR106_04446 [Mycobacterium avium subsp. paratuberculosis]|nr:hypothetical protein PICSAR106_04446 [Mycobacterium avium subsp. paratuberculosis]
MIDTGVSPNPRLPVVPGGGNAGVAGIGRGIGRIPCGAAPMMELTMVPWASQSDRPSSPMM